MKERFETKLPPFRVDPVTLRESGQVIDYWHGLMQALKLHQVTKGEKAVICVADTAWAWTHDDLPKEGNKYAINATGETAPDAHGHGHYCAGIIAGQPNEFGVLGNAPGALIIPGACLNRDGSGTWGWFAKVIRDYANADLGPYNDRIRILSASLGGPSASREVEEALAYAKAKGVIVVAAAGNAGYRPGADTIDYPGKHDHLCITVGSIGPTWNPSYFSSAGPALDVVAWGENIYSTSNQNAYARVSGTSFSTPMVAGLCALIASAHYDVFSKAKPADRKDIMEAFLKKHAKDLLAKGEDDRTGAGATVAPVYLENKPGAPAEQPEDPGEEPEKPDDGSVLEFSFRCNVVYRDQRVDGNSIFADPGGYTLDVSVEITFPTFVTDHWHYMTKNQVDLVGFIHRQVALIPKADREFLDRFKFQRWRWMNQPDASLRSLALHFREEVEKQLEKLPAEGQGKVTRIKLNNGFASATV